MHTDNDIAAFVNNRSREQRFRLPDLSMDLAYVARELGYSSGAMPEPVQHSIERALEEAEPLIDARTFWLPRPCQVDPNADTLTVDGVTLTVGRMIRGHVTHARAVALFVVTIGHRVEEEARILMKAGHTMEGYALDAIGSSAAEACADRVEADIRAEAQAAGWKITNRLSPGYCAWATQEQQKLFSLLPDRPCGIRLSPSSLMSPIKSVSGIVGLGPDVKRLEYMCSICDMTTCHKRRTS
jgi:hypothetical protein